MLSIGPVKEEQTDHVGIALLSSQMEGCKAAARFPIGAPFGVPVVGQKERREVLVVPLRSDVQRRVAVTRLVSRRRSISSFKKLDLNISFKKATYLYQNSICFEKGFDYTNYSDLVIWLSRSDHSD